jgi:hypothetical protein
MKDVSNLLDVEIENLMKSDGGERQNYEEVIRKRQLSRTLPFDERNEVSADARYITSHIVQNLWIIFVVIPVIAGLLIFAFNAMK